jgi:hypothetical protein
MVGAVSLDLGAIVMNRMTHVATLQNIRIGVWLALKVWVCYPFLEDHSTS